MGVVKEYIYILYIYRFFAMLGAFGYIFRLMHGCGGRGREAIEAETLSPGALLFLQVAAREGFDQQATTCFVDSPVVFEAADKRIWP